MSHIKKFTDFFAVFGAFCAAIYLVTQFMPFDPLEAEGLMGKVKEFLASFEKVDHKAYVILTLLFLLSFLVSRYAKKYPLPVFAVSLLPLTWCFFMFDADKLKERPMVFVIAAILHAAGSFADVVIADRRDGKKRATAAVAICSALTALFALTLYLRARSVAGVPAEEWGVFDRAIGEALEKQRSFSPYLRISLMFALISVISMLLQGLYFLDALISLIPGIFVLSHWSSGTLPAYGASVAILSAFCFLTRLILTFLPPAPQAVSAEKKNWKALLEKFKGTRKKDS